MFLVTTANQDFWKTGEKILFLGEWCKLYDQKHIWSKLAYETLPSHWEDREKINDIHAVINPGDKKVVKVGKRKFLKVI